MKQVPYPGKIDRQQLVDLCQGELPALKKQNEELAGSIDLFEKSKEDHTQLIHSLYEGLSENIGYQKALRFVCEWARDNLVEDPPIPDAEDEVLEYKESLKEHFNAG